MAPLFGPEEATRWYVPEEHVEGIVVLQKRMKLQLYDSALALLRAISHSGAEALLCVGEALGPALVLLHRSL